MYLTTAGKSFYEDIKELNAYFGNSIERAKKIAVEDEHTIKFATSILRPCNPLLNLLSRVYKNNLPFQFEIVPFVDKPKELDKVLSSIGIDIDCIVTPCDVSSWRQKYNIHLLGSYKCCISVPHLHRAYKIHSPCCSVTIG